MTLCWSASEGLSPRLGKEASLLPSNTIHTILTLPATVLSPPVHLHPDTPSPPTTSFHGWICLVLRSMHVCCFALRNTFRLSLSLFSLPLLRVVEAWRRQRRATFRKTATPTGEVSVEAARAVGHRAEALLSLGGICVAVGGLFRFLFFFFYTLLIWKTLPHKHSHKYVSHRGIQRHWFILTGFMWSNHLTNLDWDRALLVCLFTWRPITLSYC